MHGRLKVKTTAQQQEERNKERSKKAEQFQHGMKTVLENRHNENCFDNILDVSEKILSSNPDVYTLWNIRKEIIERKQRPDNENVTQLFHNELKLTQNCLHVNPKSYGVWNHRQYIMTTMPLPDWLDEMRLCNLFLQYDSRNFHCWDYRRFVVKHANISLKEELQYTTTKITENFSNYSAWHNRSRLYHVESDNGSISKDVLLRELELVRNAVFTDPNDQSAWFYQRWLLGIRKQPACLISLSLFRNPSPSLVAAFSQPVHIQATVSVNDELQTDLSWKPYDGSLDAQYSTVWSVDLNAMNNEAYVTVLLQEPKSPLLHLQLKQPDASSFHLRWITDQLTCENTSLLTGSIQAAVDNNVLLQELESCQVLYEEEPDNKWTMLTLLHLMQAIDADKYDGEMNDLIEKLVRCDHLRAGFYKDFQNKYKVEKLLKTSLTNKDAFEHVGLTNMGLTCLPYSQYFVTCTTLDLRGNPQQLKLPSYLTHFTNIIHDCK